MPFSKHTIGKGRAFVEATYPALITVLWIWLEPLGRSHYLNNAFIALNIALLMTVILVEGVPSLKEAGIIIPAETQRSSLKAAFLIICVGVSIIMGIGAVSNSIIWKPGLLKSLLVYPLWALLQGAIIFVYVLPRARIALGGHGDAYTAVLFTIIHLPSPSLTLAALLLVLVLMALWRRYHSLLAIALVHGILGAVANKTLVFSMRIGKAWFDS